MDISSNVLVKTSYATSGSLGTANQQLMRFREQAKVEKDIARNHERFFKNFLGKTNPLEFVSHDHMLNARSYYGVRLQPLPPPLRMYDRLHYFETGWAQKVKKDTDIYRVQHMMNSKQDDRNREIEILGNSEYGHRYQAPLENFQRKHGRVRRIFYSLYSTSGIHWKIQPK